MQRDQSIFKPFVTYAVTGKRKFKQFFFLVSDDHDEIEKIMMILFYIICVHNRHMLDKEL